MKSYRYAPGESNVICDRTGFQIKSSDARREWDGTVVRKESFDKKHPLLSPPKARRVETVQNGRTRGQSINIQSVRSPQPDPWDTFKP